MDMMEHPNFPDTGIGVMNDDATCDEIIKKILAGLMDYDRPEVLGAIAILVIAVINDLPKSRRKPALDQFIIALQRMTG
jgi:hypothetical protein